MWHQEPELMLAAKSVSGTHCTRILPGVRGKGTGGQEEGIKYSDI